MEKIKSQVAEEKTEELEIGNLRVEMRYTTGNRTLQECMLAILKQKEDK